MTRALLVIDVQESFKARDTWSSFADQQIVDRIQVLVETFRANSELVVWVLHAEPGTGTVFDPRLGHVTPMAGLTPIDGEPVVVKTSINAFTSTNLQHQLTKARVDEVVICGIRTEQCCETTARVASDLGFEVTFVVNATTTSPTTTLTAAQLMARTAEILRERGFARVVEVADLAAITGRAEPA